MTLFEIWIKKNLFLNLTRINTHLYSLLLYVITFRHLWNTL